MIHDSLFNRTTNTITPVTLVDETSWLNVRETLSPRAQRIAGLHGFKAKEGSVFLLPAADGLLEQVYIGLGSSVDTCDPFILAKLNDALPEGDYALEYFQAKWEPVRVEKMRSNKELECGFDPIKTKSTLSECPLDMTLAVLGFVMGRYRFTRYKTAALPNIRLQIPEGVDAHDISRIMAGITLGRDLINTPAHDCSPDTLEDAARHLADTRSGHLQVIKGDALLTHNFPLIHAVGRAASDDVARAPRLIDLIWHPKGHDVKTLPQITLVGKGVTFDTGGLNIKPDSSMLLMKKDMGGAASVLACASMIMDAELPVRLRVLIPAVENAISGQAFRPGDVLPSRKGLSVEIGNTDAEGRLILADTLTYADEGNPDLIIDMATLTGAARVALGPDLPPLMCDDDDLAQTLSRIGSTQNDPVWRLPLWTPYESMLNSKVADINNVSSSSYAGSILAALFLRKFISVERKWVHFDIFGWTPTAKPARPEGGEVQVARLVYAYVKAHLNS